MQSTHTRYITLPALPESWNQLSGRQLEEVHALIIKYRRNFPGGEGMPAGVKLECFLLFLGLKVLREKRINAKNETVFLFRRKGLRYLTERIPICAWQINQWIDEKLKFLDNVHGRFASPYPYIRVGMGIRKLKGPSDLMADCTFHQYLTLQNLLSIYWEQTEEAQKRIEKGCTHKELKQIKLRLKHIRCVFLATLFNEPVKETGEIREGRYVRSVSRTVWPYSEQQGERNAKYFRRKEEQMFPVMVQFYQSVQAYYAQIFPNLYTDSGESRKDRNHIQVEVELVNNIMKYQGFSDYDAVYDSEAIRILGIMDAMSSEAKEIKKMNDKYGKKK